MEEVLASIGSEMAAATDWGEVMSLEVEMAQQERMRTMSGVGITMPCGRSLIELDVEQLPPMQPKEY